MIKTLIGLTFGYATYVTWAPLWGFGYGVGEFLIRLYGGVVLAILCIGFLMSSYAGSARTQTRVASKDN